MNLPLISIAILTPLVGVVLAILIPNPANLKKFGLWISGAVLVLAGYMLLSFVPEVEGFQFQEQHRWHSLGGYNVGLDGISIWFFFLTALLTPLAMLFVDGAIKHKTRQYVMCFLLLEMFLLGAFSALDLVLFYVFFEGALIPMFLIIGAFGGAMRIQAAYTFFLYTLAGSVLMLVAILVLANYGGSTSIEMLAGGDELPTALQKWLWLAFFASFAVKSPMFPFHTWLPLAHVEAPTAGSVLLAGVLLKLGGYGFLRFSLPLFPDASIYFAPLVISLSVVAIIYGSMMAYAQQDMKKLIAYSSVAHMGFVTLGIFSFQPQGVEGAVFQMVSHGLVSAALFFTVGVLYERLGSRNLADGGGLATTMPKAAVLTMVFTMAAVGLPATTGFVGEFLVLTAAWAISTVVALGAVLGIVLSAVYMLGFYKRVFLANEPMGEAGTMGEPLAEGLEGAEGIEGAGEATAEGASEVGEGEYIGEGTGRGTGEGTGEGTAISPKTITDLTPSEFAVMALFATAILGLGIFPNGVLSYLPADILASLGVR